ncbi:MAG: 4-(cytidine 5'-diphospho)-2-C-methyl-D-erythritol kinase [Verrucomicrobia bacterium]|nr:4-(cytidine 5'-diphospho)-2-C-methyl-D-erythritol kinase [Verrucomicrobiota bacterium]
MSSSASWSRSRSPTLTLEVGRPLGLTCDDASLPVDGTNLVLKAAAAYARRRPAAPTGHFHLSKKVPHGAGLGGGSSDAAATLRLLDQASGAPLGVEALEALAAEVGSDCAFFVRGQSAVMRGRGERLEILPAAARAALAGRKVVLVKPPFGVPTPEAYGLLAKAGRYRPAAQAEAELAGWIARPAADPSDLGNDLAAPVFAKYLALPVGLASFHRTSGADWQMTGSGSACFAFVSDGFDHARLREDLRRAWGPAAWVEETVISG